MNLRQEVRLSKSITEPMMPYATIKTANARVNAARVSRCLAPAFSPLSFQAWHMGFCVGRKQVKEAVAARQTAVVTRR